MSLSYMTAITRNKPSAPTMWLENKSKINGHILDYGAGKLFDTKYLKKNNKDIIGYDPHYAPNTITNGMNNCFDTIICNFVLNTIEGCQERENVIHHIKGLLRPNGRAYVSIRADKKKLNGFTKRGTFQTYVTILPAHGFTLIHKTGSYELYEYIKP